MMKKCIACCIHIFFNCAPLYRKVGLDQAYLYGKEKKKHYFGMPWVYGGLWACWRIIWRLHLAHISNMTKKGDVNSP